MTSTRRLFGCLLFLLGFPFLAKAQLSCGSQNPCVSFGEVSTVPRSTTAGYHNPYPYTLIPKSYGGSVGPFTAQWPGSVSYYSNMYVNVSFSPTTPGSYSGSVSATYYAPQYPSDQVTITITAAGQWGNPVSGFINPKYVIIGVEYNPPGTGSSVRYGSNTVVGTSTSIGSSFSSGVSQSVSSTSGIDIFGFTASKTNTSSNSYTQETDTSSSFAVQQTTSNTTGVNDLTDCNGASIHDHDLVYVWLNPILTFTTYTDIPKYVTWTGYGYDLNDTPAYPYMEVDSVEMGVLNWHLPFPTCSPGQGCLADRFNRSWALNNVDGSGPALTGNGAACVSGSGSDICNLLAADKFSDPTYVPTFNPPSQTTTDGLFTACTNSGCSSTIDISPGSSYNHSQGTSTTASQSQGGKNTYSETFSAQEQFKTSGWLGNLSSNFQTSTTLTWVNQFNQSTNNSQGQTAQFTVQGPSCWAGPASYDVYQDNLYGTFVFWPVQ